VPTLTTTDGLTIAWDEWGRDGHDPALPPVLLHHGFAVDARINFVQPGVVDALVGARRHVVGLDARGHGRSSAPHDPELYGEARMAADVSALIDAVLADRGSDEVHLVGYSMGAIVSLLAAAADARVVRLVVGGIGAAVVELGGLDTRAVPNDEIAAALLADDPATISHEGAIGFRLLADAVGADRLALAAQASRVHAEPLPLDRIAAPTLVLAGADDPLADRPDVLADALTDGRVRLVEGDHLTAVAAPGFAAAIVEFLAG
jgi:pimeloyl-ACP methyl ester carboxylesterase